MTATLPVLLRHQLRLLLQNRSACVVLLTFGVAITLLGIRPNADSERTCYLLYWRNDDWVRKLRVAARHAEGPLEIKVAPASEFTNQAGLISYPVGAHSIQLRPPGEGLDRWVVWYWYSGSDPSVLQPAIAWFWSVTNEHFAEQTPIEVRTSALEPIAPFLQSARISTRTLLRGDVGKALTIWSAIFFCACYLPAVGLGHQIEHRTLYSLVTTRAGWWGPIVATAVFHGAIALAFGCTGLWFLQSPPADLQSWATVVLSIALYLGVGITVGCWSRSVITASGAIMVYLLASGSLASLGYFVPAVSVAAGVEWNIVGVLLGSAQRFHIIPLVGWMVFWLSVSVIAIRRLRCA